MNQMCGLNYIGTIEEGKPAVIFVPGTLISPSIFKKVKIPKGYQPVYLSWIDTEGSHDIREIAGKLSDMIKQCRFKKTILAGYSSGGSIVMLTCLVLKGRSPVDGLLLSNTGANNDGHNNKKSKEEIIASWNEKELDAFIRRCFARKLDAEMYEELMNYGRNISAEVRAEPLESQREVDLMPLLHEITCPTIIAHGSLDAIRTVDQATQLLRGIPNSELILLETGHSPMYEDSEGYSNALARLAEKIEMKQ